MHLYFIKLNSYTLANPLLLILGVPNVTSANFTAPAITLSAGTGVVGGTNVGGGT